MRSSFGLILGRQLCWCRLPRSGLASSSDFIIVRSRGDADPAKTAARLKLSNVERRRLLDALRPDAPTPTPKLDAGARALAAHRLGSDTAADRALLAWADERADAARPAALDVEDWRDVVDEAARWTSPPRPFDGADAQALGARPGPTLGGVLAAVETWWIEGGAAADRAACLERLKSEIAARS